jgi:hypothetical protein
MTQNNSSVMCGRCRYRGVSVPRVQSGRVGLCSRPRPSQPWLFSSQPGAFPSRLGAGFVSARQVTRHDTAIISPTFVAVHGIAFYRHVMTTEYRNIYNVPHNVPFVR